ncbi:MAG: MotA/TolQ/ExbB proton channel family protein [Pseudomonadota bacterium]
MFNPTLAYEALLGFLAAGGNVLVIIMGVTFLMWAFILERVIFWTTAKDAVYKRAQRAWDARNDKKSWYAHAVRDKLIADTRSDTERFNGFIRVLVAVTPLLGLLGTVTGMVEVFNVMAATGTSNARLMAGGITKATIPTMAGLVASLSGVIFINAFDSYVKQAEQRVSAMLRIE